MHHPSFRTRSTALLLLTMLTLVSVGCGSDPDPGEPAADAGLSPDMQTPPGDDAGNPMDIDAGSPMDIDAGNPMDIDSGNPMDIDAGSPMDVDAGIADGGMSTGLPPLPFVPRPDRAPSTSTPELLFDGMYFGALAFHVLGGVPFAMSNGGAVGFPIDRVLAIDSAGTAFPLTEPASRLEPAPLADGIGWVSSFSEPVRNTAGLFESRTLAVETLTGQEAVVREVHRDGANVVTVESPTGSSFATDCSIHLYGRDLAHVRVLATAISCGNTYLTITSDAAGYWSRSGTTWTLHMIPLDGGMETTASLTFDGMPFGLEAAADAFYVAMGTLTTPSTSIDGVYRIARSDGAVTRLADVFCYELEVDEARLYCVAPQTDRSGPQRRIVYVATTGGATIDVVTGRMRANRMLATTTALYWDELPPPGFGTGSRLYRVRKP